MWNIGIGDALATSLVSHVNSGIFECVRDASLRKHLHAARDNRGSCLNFFEEFENKPSLKVHEFCQHG